MENILFKEKPRHKPAPSISFHFYKIDNFIEPESSLLVFRAVQEYRVFFGGNKNVLEPSRGDSS